MYTHANAKILQNKYIHHYPHKALTDQDKSDAHCIAFIFTLYYYLFFFSASSVSVTPLAPYECFLATHLHPYGEMYSFTNSSP